MFKELERLDIGKAEFDTECGREQLVTALLDAALCSSPGLHRDKPEHLPRRYLPPGKYADLYRLFVAFCFSSGTPVCSAATFYRVLKQSGWRKKLLHRGKTTHTKCTTCHRLKAAIRKSTSLQSHAENADKYMRHIAGQYSDRRCYWQLRHRAATEKNIIVIIQDSMDRSKYKLPRFSDGVVPKALELKPRPELEVTACIVHGRGVFVWVSDPEQSFGTNWNIEVMARTLEICFNRAQQNNEPWPRCCKIFSDNTPKEPCLCFVFLFAIWMTCFCLIHKKSRHLASLSGNQKLSL